jgi:GNAT superfamily N-acetyltransferase
MYIEIRVAEEKHFPYVDTILSTIEVAAKKRGTGIARRSPDYIRQKMVEGKAIIALDAGTFVGFCYIETWSHAHFAANSGLIVSPDYQGLGLAKKIKRFAFEYSRRRFPQAKLFGLTSGLAVMKINTALGYVPTTFSELTDDEAFWSGCRTCVNYDVLTRNDQERCICTALIYDPDDHPTDTLGEQPLGVGELPRPLFVEPKSK